MLTGIFMATRSWSTVQPLCGKSVHGINNWPSSPVRPQAQTGTATQSGPSVHRLRKISSDKSAAQTRQSLTAWCNLATLRGVSVNGSKKGNGYESHCSNPGGCSHQL